MKVHLSILSIITLAAGCASTYRPSESIEAKMARYESNKKMINVVPDMTVKDVNVSQRARGPASREKNEVLDSMEQKSSKRLYFSTLFTQYEYLRNLDLKESAPVISHCPNFHSSVVEIREQNPVGTERKSIDWKSRYKGDWQTLSYQFPELNLPVDDYQQHPKVAEVMSNPEYMKKYGDRIDDIMNKALSLHLFKTYRELNELCEIGTSDNYYSYENLLGHIERHANVRAPESENMKTLYKTTLFSNMALIHSLNEGGKRSRTPASASEVSEQSYHQAVMKRFKVEWVGDYFKTLR